MEKTLKLLIELGVIGKADAEAAKDLLRETKDEVAAMNESIPENLQNLEKQKDALNEVGHAAHGAGAEHRAIHHALHKLNEIVPGLGTALAMLSHSFMESGEAAKGAAHETEGFITSMGPIVVLTLAIEAAAKWYDFLKEGAKEAGEAQSEAFKKADEGARTARESLEKYTEAMAKARETGGDYRTGLALDNSLLDAQATAHRNVLKALEATELAQAKSEEAKKAIKQKYADLEADSEKKTAEERIEITKQAIDRLVEKETELVGKKGELEDARNLAAHQYGAADPRARAHDKEIEDLQTEIAKLEQEKNRLNTEVGNMGQINAVTNQGKLDSSIASGDVAHSAKGIADTVSGGGFAPTDQKAFMTMFADDMAHRMGALRADQNFANAQAAAAFIENFFKTQPDPYNALFGQIHAAVVAAKSGQDAMATLWMGKFKDLEDKLKAGAFNVK